MKAIAKMTDAERLEVAEELREYLFLPLVATMEDSPWDFKDRDEWNDFLDYVKGCTFTTISGASAVIEEDYCDTFSGWEDQKAEEEEEQEEAEA